MNGLFHILIHQEATLVDKASYCLVRLARLYPSRALGVADVVCVARAALGDVPSGRVRVSL